MTDTATTDPTHPIADTDAVIDNAEEEEDSVRASPFCLVYAHSVYFNRALAGNPPYEEARRGDGT